MALGVKLKGENFDIGVRLALLLLGVVIGNNFELLSCEGFCRIGDTLRPAPI